MAIADLLRIKFRQSKTYTQDMLVRDLIEQNKELLVVLNQLDARIKVLEAKVP